MNKVLISEYKPNCYVLVSGTNKEGHGVGVRPYVSLLYEQNDIAIEWGIEYGPIQRLEKCGADHPEAREHYFYDYVINKFRSWTQCDVDDNNLPEAFLLGNWDYIFKVLKRFAE